MTKDAKAPYGIRVGGAPIFLANQAVQDKSAVLHLVDGALLPPTVMPQVKEWQAASKPGAAAAADKEGAGAAGAGAAGQEAAASGARGAAAGAVAALAGAAAVLSMLA